MRRLPHVLVLLAACLAAFAAMPAASQAKPGVVYGIEQFGNIENPEYTALFHDTMKQDGAKVARYVIRWDWVAKECDPRTRGNAADFNNPCYNWGFLDGVVRSADARGITTLSSVYGTPRWMFDDGENFTGSSDADFARFVSHYADFVQAAATRYDGRHGLPRIDQWTIWNEPNGSFFQPRMVNGVMVGPARYARLYDAGARRIKAIDPSFRVAVGPTAPYVKALPPLDWARGVLTELDRLGSPVDAYAHNAYTGKQSPLHNTIQAPFIGLGNIGDLTAEMDRHSISRGKPVWITEFGYQTGGAQKAIEPEEQPALMADALYFAWAQPRIDTFIWYQLHDDSGDSQWDFLTGLYYKVGCGGLCPKPGAGMYRHSIWVSQRSSTGQVTMWGQGRLQPAATRIFVQRPGDGWRAYFNTDTQQTGTVYIRMALPSGTVVRTCDVRCGPTTKVATTVSGGGGTRIQRLATVNLGRRASLRNGIIYGVNCTSCTVTAKILARGRLSGIAAARTRTIIVGSGRVRSVRGGKQVHDVFTRAAIRELSRRRTAVLTLRTWIRHSNGQLVITDRPVRLR
jgi:hypothetical protein